MIARPVWILALLLFVSSSALAQLCSSTTQVVTFAVHRSPSLQVESANVDLLRDLDNLADDSQISREVTIPKITQKKFTITSTESLTDRDRQNATRNNPAQRQTSESRFSAKELRGILVTVTD